MLGTPERPLCLRLSGPAGAVHTIRHMDPISTYSGDTEGPVWFPSAIQPVSEMTQRGPNSSHADVAAGAGGWANRPQNRH